jgi:cytochrome c oxidase subunit 4
MSIEEKKALYRASFCQTYAEMRAPNGEWKSVIGCALGFVALSYWMYMWAKVFGKCELIYVSKTMNS